jgi:hypothetical protein
LGDVLKSLHQKSCGNAWTENNIKNPFKKKQSKKGTERKLRTKLAINHSNF